MKSVAQSGIILIREQILTNFYHVIWSNTQEPLIKCRVMSFTKRQPVSYGSNSFGMRIGHDVGCIQQRRLMQCANGAPLSVGVHNHGTKHRLVETLADCASGIAFLDLA